MKFGRYSMSNDFVIVNVCFSDKLLRIPALITKVLSENRKRKVCEILEHLLYSGNKRGQTEG